MSTFSERLREQRVELGMSQTEFAAVAGVGKQSQINYESGKRQPDAAYLSAISGIGADVLYILTGRRELSAAGEWTMKDVENAVLAGAMRGTQVQVMRETAGEARPIYNVSLDGADYAAIPRVDARLAAGGGALNDQVERTGALAFRRDWLRERDISPDKACLLRVTGDNMAPTLHDGDLVMIDERRTAIRNRHVYALVDTDGAARVKRLDLVPDQLIILTSDNPTHATETRSGPDMNRVRILGEIVWSAHAW
jgi:phage repressor protein C with HTH and peptisase S24 domain